MESVLIKNFSAEELEAWVRSLGEKPFRARQLFRHMYARNVGSWDECTDLSRTFRDQLRFACSLDALEIARVDKASDETTKYLFRLRDGNHIESVLIPHPPSYTLCVSSQVGCALGCKFCLTGSLGFKRNLETAEIVDQACRILRDPAIRPKITNIVFMGMGEPLANYDAVIRAIRIITDMNGLAFSHRRVTLSTVGLVPQMRRLGLDTPVNLAVSLHAAEDRLRNDLMPVNRTYPLDELMRACRDYPLPTRKRITFEYILLDGVNDSPGQARDLVRILHGVRAKVNLIPFNPHPGAPFGAPSEERILAFQEVLQKARLTAIIRKSRGHEISAACGQLAAKCAVPETSPCRDIDIGT
ncbi:MAG: 23S rRNA (adenine(2503)-C(2))-methyltransferase RlmN [Desulfobacteraceae bacterium]|nr:23S rRNA (adenine(2503)-C(2))-methyltransferase RlmN [Desulfobacteraceae bacterium]